MALSLALGALAPAAQAAGATYYVATGGSDGACSSNSQAAPFLTVAHALTCAGDGDTIRIAAGAFAGGVTIAHNVTLQGAGAGATTLQGGVPVVTVDGGVTTTIEDLTISGDSTGHQGGGIFNEDHSTLMVVDSTISGNYGDFGGGIDNLGALTVVGSTISGNQAGRGAGIWNQGTLTVASSTISGNQANELPGDGGGIDNVGTATLTNSTISGNSADYPGGGADNLGGGIRNNGTLTVGNSTITVNSAVHGGGAYNQGHLTVDHSTLSGNTTTGAAQGGAIFNDGQLTVSDSTLSANHANQGGGIYNYTGSTVTLLGSTLSDNIVPHGSGGGGIYNYVGATVAASNSTLSGNQAGFGGGIFNDGPLTLVNGTISSNTASNTGGGIFNNATVALSNTLLAGNAASGAAPDCSGGSVDDGPGGHNLLGDDSSCVGLANGTDGDRVGSGAHPLDPKLGPLGPNGGPTETMALLAGSPAIGAADVATCEQAPINDLDQRGAPRNAAIRGACDIGAYDTGAYSRTIITPLAGSLVLTSGSTLVLDTSVGGSIIVQPGAALTLVGTTLRGGVQATGASFLTVCGSTLASLSASGSTGPVLVGSGGDADTTACAANTIKGAVTLAASHGQVELGGNQITGGVSVTNNSGAGSEAAGGAPEIEGDQIGGSLICSGNSPAPTNDGKANTVGGARTGQCTGL